MFGFSKKSEERSVSASTILELFGITSTSTVTSPSSISTAYACIRLISNSVASIPLKHFSDNDGKKEEQKGSAITRVLKKPNPYMTYFDLMSQMVYDVQNEGNGYAIIMRDPMGTLDMLVYVPASSVSLYVTQDMYNPYYYVVEYFGETMTIFPEDIIHIKNTARDTYGFNGISPMTLHRMTFENAQSLETYSKTYLDNAAQIAGVIESERKLSKETIEELRKNFSKKFAGTNNAGRTPVLPEGLKYKQLKVMSPMDTQYIENKRLTQSEICQIFAVPESLLGVGEQKYSNAEQQQLAFHNYTIEPLLMSIQEEFSAKLVPTWKPRDVLEFKPSPLKYASSKEKAETVSLLRNSSIMTPNEARDVYDLNHMTGEVASKLKDELESARASEVGDAVADPKDTEPTNTDPNVSGMTDAQFAKRFEELAKELHRLKTDNGRIRKELRQVLLQAETPDER